MTKAMISPKISAPQIIYPNLTKKEFDQFYGSDSEGEVEGFDVEELPISCLMFMNTEKRSGFLANRPFQN